VNQNGYPVDQIPADLRGMFQGFVSVLVRFFRASESKGRYGTRGPLERSLVLDLLVSLELQLLNRCLYVYLRVGVVGLVVQLFDVDVDRARVELVEDVVEPFASSDSVEEVFQAVSNLEPQCPQ